MAMVTITNDKSNSERYDVNNATIMVVSLAVATTQLTA